MRIFIFSCFISLLALTPWQKPAFADHFQLVTAPFIPFTNPQDPQQGYLVELTRQALAINGHSLEVTFQPWPRALLNAAHGHFDGVISAYYTEERARDFYYSSPLNTTEMVFIGLKENIDIERYFSLNALKRYSIAVGRKWAYSKEFDHNKKLNKTTVNDEQSAIKLLYNKRIDLIAINQDQFVENLRHLKEYDPGKITILQPAIAQTHNYVAAPKTHSKSLYFIAELNNGIADLRASGQLDALRKDYLGF